jgi:XTP/dITP diphosphohydrolase/tetrapyrrole methylase family protein/MazG family protein/ATP diphosphatase
VPGGDGLAEAVLDLAALAERLRRECPWDRAQTERTIVPHTLEEAYETADAALAGDDAKLLDELGDLLFQTVLLALLLEERGAGDLAEVARRIHEKLVRRHPHVFGAAPEPGSAGEVKARWEDLKAEQEGRQGVFHDVPENLPGLLYARKVQRRAAARGFDFDHAVHALVDVDNELEELRQEVRPVAPETEPDPRVEAELGDLLFACVNVARHANVDPELALRGASRRFVDRVETAVALAARDGTDWSGLDVGAQDRYFDLAKEEERR